MAAVDTRRVASKDPDPLRNVRWPKQRVDFRVDASWFRVELIFFPSSLPSNAVQPFYRFCTSRLVSPLFYPPESLVSSDRYFSTSFRFNHQRDVLPPPCFRFSPLGRSHASARGGFSSLRCECLTYRLLHEQNSPEGLLTLLFSSHLPRFLSTSTDSSSSLVNVRLQFFDVFVRQSSQRLQELGRAEYRVRVSFPRRVALWLLSSLVDLSNRRPLNLSTTSTLTVPLSGSHSQECSQPFSRCWSEVLEIKKRTVSETQRRLGTSRLGKLE